MPGMTAASSSSAVKGVRSVCCFCASLGAGALRSTFFLASASRCACADAHSDGANDVATVHSRSPAATAEAIRSVCKVALRRRRTAFLFGLTLADVRRAVTPACATPGLHGSRYSASARHQPCVALQTPEHPPDGPWPRHVPLPRPADSLPTPAALWPPAETFTFTWPFGDTRPETLTAAPPRYETELPRIIIPYRYDWSQPPLLVMTTTLHGPSNDAASADGVAARALAAKAVASKTARVE